MTPTGIGQSPAVAAELANLRYGERNAILLVEIYAHWRNSDLVFDPERTIFR